MVISLLKQGLEWLDSDMSHKCWVLCYQSSVLWDLCELLEPLILLSFGYSIYEQIWMPLYAIIQACSDHPTYFLLSLYLFHLHYFHMHLISHNYPFFCSYAWTITYCASCESNIGWLFTARKKNLLPRSFWGIRSSQVKDSECWERTKSY